MTSILLALSLLQVPFHAEPPVYVLTVVEQGQLGSSLQRVADDCTMRRPECHPFDGPTFPVEGNARVASRHAEVGELARLVAYLQQALGAEVVNETGLQGTYAWRLTHRSTTPSSLINGSAPDIFMALEEQLGLRLERVRR